MSANRSDHTESALLNPPRGCRLTDDWSETNASVSLWSPGTFLAITFGCLFWNGIVGMFVVLALRGFYWHYYGYPLPDWLGGHEIDSVGSFHSTLALSFFLIPFVCLGILLFANAVLVAFGRQELVMTERGASVRTRIGPIKWNRRFDPKQVKTVLLHSTTVSSAGSKPPIEILADKRIRFGQMIPEERRHWIFSAAKKMLKCEV